MSIKLGKRDVLVGNLWQAGGGERIPKNWLSPRKKQEKGQSLLTPLRYTGTYVKHTCIKKHAFSGEKMD